MPTYSYECRKCGVVHDVFHAMNASPRVKCPVCGGGCKRLLGAGAGIIFKGAGFYETDYKRKSGTPAGSGKTETKKETGGDTKAASKTDTKTDSKPSSKKDA